MGEGCWLNLHASAILNVLSHLDPVCLLQLNGSVGLNIFSAICSAVGIILLITDMSISGTYVYPNDYPYYYYSMVSVLNH